MRSTDTNDMQPAKSSAKLQENANMTTPPMSTGPRKISSFFTTKLFKFHERSPSAITAIVPETVTHEKCDVTELSDDVTFPLSNAANGFAESLVAIQEAQELRGREGPVEENITRTEREAAIEADSAESEHSSRSLLSAQEESTFKTPSLPLDSEPITASSSITPQDVVPSPMQAVSMEYKRNNSTTTLSSFVFTSGTTDTAAIPNSFTTRGNFFDFEAPDADKLNVNTTITSPLAAVMESTSNSGVENDSATNAIDYILDTIYPPLVQGRASSTKDVPSND
jgi:hypothetical protein